MTAANPIELRCTMQKPTGFYIRAARNFIVGVTPKTKG